MKRLFFILFQVITFIGLGQKFVSYNQSVIESNVLNNFNTKNHYTIIMDSLEFSQACVGACKQYLLSMSNKTDPNTGQQGVVISKISIGENNPEEFGVVVWSKFITHIDQNRNLEALFISGNLANLGAWDGVTPYDSYFLKFDVNTGNIVNNGELNTNTVAIKASVGGETYIARFGGGKGNGRLILPQDFSDPLNYYSREFSPMDDNGITYNLRNNFIPYSNGFIELYGTALAPFSSSSSEFQNGTGFLYRENYISGNSVTFFTLDTTSNQHIRIYDWIKINNGYLFSGKNYINNKAVYFKTTLPDNGFEVVWAYEVDKEGAYLHLSRDINNRSWLRFGSTNSFSASEEFPMTLIDENGQVVREIYSNTETGDDNFSGIIQRLPFTDAFGNYHNIAIENNKIFQFNMDWENCKTINYDSTTSNSVYTAIDIYKANFTSSVGQFETVYQESTNSINPTLTNNLVINDNYLQITSFCENLGISQIGFEKIECYPNPTSNSFTISSDNLINSEFKMIDAQGREVLTGSMNGQEHTIDISKLSNGVYSVVFNNTKYPVVSVIKE